MYFDSPTTARLQDAPASEHPGYRRFWWTIPSAILLFQLLVDLFVSYRWADLISGVGLLIEAFIAAFVCLWRARQCKSRGIYLWILAGVAELIHFAGRSLVGIETVFWHESHSSVAISDFLIFQWGSPLLLALSIPTERSARLLFKCLDGIQIVLLFVVLFAVFFGGVSGTTTLTVTLSPEAAVLGFALENLLLAFFAWVRLQSQPANPEQKSFLASLSVFLWLYALLAPIYNFANYLAVRRPVGLQWLLAIPELFLAWFALFPPSGKESLQRTNICKRLALILDNGSSILFPAIILFLAIVIAQKNLVFGLSSIVISMFIYGVRSTVLQIRYQEAQTEIVEAKDRLEQLAHTDSLTGLQNRRAFDKALQEAWDQSRRFGFPVSILMVDVDYFKHLNDTFGHAEGDRCLHAIAHALVSVLRHEKDLVARYGGEEFAVVLFDAPSTGGEHVAERMRNAVAGLALRNHTPIGDHVTISIGVAVSTEAASVAELLARADGGLYRAKRGGRNRTESS